MYFERTNSVNKQGQKQNQIKTAKTAITHFDSSPYRCCRLCRRNCRVDRTRTTGFCGMPDRVFAARAALHAWEEPCISGPVGSGTVFFSGCSLRCVYCQNHSIALGETGKPVTTERLADIFLELQQKGAANINLVTPTHYVPSILSALDRARANGLTLPIVYNTGNYETLETLKMLEGYVDIFLPDFKYWDSSIASRYSGAPDYAIHARENLAEMFRQVGTPVFADTGCRLSASGNCDDDLSEASLMKRGMIVRHLALPGAAKDSRRILRYLYETYGNDIYLSIMNQYTPLTEHLTGYPELNRRITDNEYNALIDYCIGLGIENAFIQEGETATESFIPVFDCEGI